MPTNNPKSKIENPKSIDPLISLLDDPDPFVQESVRSRLFDIGVDVAPRLRQVLLAPSDEVSRVNASSVLCEMGVRRFRAELDLVVSVASDHDIDLEHGAFAIALLGYPEIRISEYTDRLDVMASRLKLRINDGMEAVAVLHEMTSYLVGDLGFQGCMQAHYNEPDNSYMNRVMDRRVGIPVTLSVVYLLLAHRLGLPLYGTNFPTHFLTKYRTPSDEYYLDAFNGGVILDRGDCRRFLRDLGFNYHPSLMALASNRQIVVRMMRNLAELYGAERPELTEELVRAMGMVLAE